MTALLVHDEGDEMDFQIQEPAHDCSASTFAASTANVGRRPGDYVTHSIMYSNCALDFSNKIVVDKFKYM